MSRKIPNRILFPALGFVLLTGGCGPQGPPDRALGTPPPPPVRPSDGLLHRETLQRAVDFQVERDGGALIRLLADPDPLVRARAAFALASVQDPEAGPPLSGLLTDSEAPVRRDAAFALGQLSDARYGGVLLGALGEEEDPDVRMRIFEAVGKVGDELVLERLVELDLPPEESALRNLAVSRMGVRGVVLPSAIRHMVEELRNPDLRARENAGYYFGRSTATGPWTAFAPQVRAALDSLPPDDPLAMHLLLGLASLGDPQDTPRFLWWLRMSPDWRIRTNAARGMGPRTADPRVRRELMDALEDPSTHVAYSAATALTSASRLPPGEGDDLKSWVESHWEDWRRAGPILALLGRQGQGAFILEWLGRWGEEEVIPRTRGLGALAFVPGAEAFDVLAEAVGSESSRIRGTALGGLARRWRVERNDSTMHARYFQAFSRGLQARDPASTYVAAPALADSVFLALGSLDLLEEAYKDMSLPGDLDGMLAILEALGQTGAPEAETILRQGMEHPNHSIRETAARALAGLRGEEIEAAGGVTPAEKTIDWEGLGRLGSRPHLVLQTEKGAVTLVLDTEGAPLTVQTIAGFAMEGKYDGVPFHRVVPNFVVQGGDFTRRDGYGGPGFEIRSEFNEIPYRRGVLGMASSGKDTEGSQFFITHSMQPHLDGAYTTFGWVEVGMDAVDLLYEEDLIVSARVEPGSP
ncbi:MAG: peptidylprolyl isomerase [Gemmatimonadota bacterium]|jgi:peptidylprolyl isomerase